MPQLAEGAVTSQPTGSDERARSAGDVARAASETLLAGILSIAADAIIVVDEALCIVNFNHGAEQIFGYAAPEAVGQPLDILLPERFRATHGPLVRAFGAGQGAARRMGHRREIYGRRKSGEEFPAEASISKLALPDGRVVYSAVLRDVTERKRAEQEQQFLAGASAVLASSLDYDATLSAVPALAVPLLGEWCALAVLEREDAIRVVTAPHANPERSRGLEELARRYPLDWDSPWPAVDVLRTGRSEHVADVTGDWLDAHVVDAEHARLLRDAGLASLLVVPLVARDQVLGALTCARGGEARPFDDEDLALARDLALRAALAIDNARLYGTAQRATEARDVVLGVVSHDLRNPLSAIAMCARALRESPPADEAGRRHLADAISDSAEWMNRLIQDLLDVASIEAGRLSIERRAEAPAEIVERLLVMFERMAAERRIALRTDVAPDLPAAYGDGERILQVLANLVGNALKFSPPGGEVTVAVTVGDAAGATELQFSVEDPGPGIPEQDLPHLFELYWHVRRTARVQGSGYGLAIAKGIIEAHGGRIWAESVLGAGSTFHFTVPADVHAVRAHTPARQGKPTGPGSGDG